MFTYEERIRAVNLYLKYESWCAVINELGYPSVGALRQCVKEYQETDTIHKISSRNPKYI